MVAENSKPARSPTVREDCRRAAVRRSLIFKKIPLPSYQVFWGYISVPQVVRLVGLFLSFPVARARAIFGA